MVTPLISINELFIFDIGKMSENYIFTSFESVLANDPNSKNFVLIKKCLGH